MFKPGDLVVAREHDEDGVIMVVEETTRSGLVFVRRGRESVAYIVESLKTLEAATAPAAKQQVKRAK